jgi:Zn finger protein HypA/HybF involved in hydrogenase expression
MSEEFNDPVVRCTDCQRITTREEIRKFRMCPDCGNKRFRNVLVLNKKEMDSLKAQDIDADFLSLFEAVD